MKTSTRFVRSFFALSLVTVPACSGGAEDTSGGQGGDGGAATSEASSGDPTASGMGGAGGASGSTSDTGGTGGSSSSSSASTGGMMCTGTDPCPAPSGVTFGCDKRFMYGANYAWKNFATDFGGLKQWNQKGISEDPAPYAQTLADMHAHGVSVVRWWIFPDMRGDGVAFDGADNPTGLGGTAAADIAKALDLAAEADIYLMLTVFSFDAFRPTKNVSGVNIRGLTPFVTAADKRALMMKNVVRPLAKAAANSPHRERLIAWDVINEPEWAMTGPSPYGDQAYDPIGELVPVSHAEMEAFVSETIKTLRSESSALVTVGCAAAKWAKAWTKVGVDFYTLHIYDWVNQYWPYTDSPADLGLTDKPVVMGEFPVGGLSGVPYAKLLDTLYKGGYAGALGWDYTSAKPADLDAMKSFGEVSSCEKHY